MIVELRKQEAREEAFFRAADAARTPEGCERAHELGAIAFPGIAAAYSDEEDAA